MTSPNALNHFEYPPLTIDISCEIIKNNNATNNPIPNPAPS